MKTAKGLMLSLIAGTAEQAGALFADDGTLEHPYLASIGLPPVTTGPLEITKFLNFVHGALYPGFSFKEVEILIDTPDQVLAEYHINHKSAITGVEIHKQSSGIFKPKAAKNARLRETLDVVQAAEVIYPKGLAEVIATRSQTAHDYHTQDHHA